MHLSFSRNIKTLALLTCRLRLYAQPQPALHQPPRGIIQSQHVFNAELCYSLAIALYHLRHDGPDIDLCARENRIANSPPKETGPGRLPDLPSLCFLHGYVRPVYRRHAAYVLTIEFYVRKIPYVPLPNG
jgi:hypothetical protein